MPRAERPAITAETLAQFRQNTRLDQWRTPANLSDAYNFVPKHIIRQIQKPVNKIAAVNINGRWLILKCSFEKYLDWRDPLHTDWLLSED